MRVPSAWVKPRPLQHCAARQIPHVHRHPESGLPLPVAYAQGIVVFQPGSRNAGEWMSDLGRPPASYCASYFGTRQLHSRHGSKISHNHGMPSVAEVGTAWPTCRRRKGCRRREDHARDRCRNSIRPANTRLWLQLIR